MRPPAASSFLYAVIAAGACALASLGCSSVAYSSVTSGSYHNREVSPGPLGLDLDRGAFTATFTVPGAAAVVRTFVAIDREKWPTRCRSNFKAARTELLDLSAAPLQIGGKTFPRPVVLADCYSGSGIEVETLGAGGEPDPRVRLAFYR